MRPRTRAGGKGKMTGYLINKQSLAQRPFGLQVFGGTSTTTLQLSRNNWKDI